jgi:NTE family protein
MMKRLRVGLALGGGGARGLAHIGVMEVLEGAGVPVDMVAGTSIGALVGGIYLLERQSARLRPRMLEFLESETFKQARFDVLRERKEGESAGFIDSMALTLRRGWMYSYSITRQSIISQEAFFEINNHLFGDRKIEELPLPFAAVSLDINSATEFIWTRGSLRDAVMASSAIPGFFPPLELDGRLLVDGGWIHSVPIRPARSLGADIVIAVDTSRERDTPFEYKRGIDLILRTAFIMMKQLRELQLEEADIVIQPDVTDIHWADFQNPEVLLQKGRDAAISALPEIRSLMRRRRIKNVFLPFRRGSGTRKSF